MPTHFSSIGFLAPTAGEYLDLIKEIANKAEAIDVQEGTYLKWSPGTGEEVWLHLDQAGDFTAAIPHYRGNSVVPVELDSRVIRDSYPLESSFRAGLNPPQQDAPKGEERFTFIFDCPDSALYGDIMVPGWAAVQVAAFAHEVSMHASRETALDSALNLAPGSSLPRGQILLSAEILDSALRRNSLTGHAYYWALVETIVGPFDVVIDPSLLPDVPNVGEVLLGSFWLSGRLVSFTRRGHGTDAASLKSGAKL